MFSFYFVQTPIDIMDYFSTNQMKKPRGQIQLILGPMFAGKSTELIRRFRRYLIIGHKCLMIKYSKDERYSSEQVVTHDKTSISGVKADQLDEKIVAIANDYDVVGVDEGQFFPDVVDFCELMANKGKIVVVSALDGTFERKPFGTILGLIPLAEDVVKLNAICNICKGQAAFTKRTTNETEVEVIGGSDKYIATCRSCFTEETTVDKLGTTPLKNITNDHEAGMLIM